MPIFRKDEKVVSPRDPRMAPLMDKARELFELAKPYGAESAASMNQSDDAPSRTLFMAAIALANVAKAELPRRGAPMTFASAVGSMASAYGPQLGNIVMLEAYGAMEQAFRDCTAINEGAGIPPAPPAH